MEKREAGMSADQRKDFHVAHPMTEASASRASMRFQQIDPKTRQKINTQSSDVRKLSEKRNSWESAPTTEKTKQPNKGLFKTSEHKETVTQPEERKGNVTQPSEHKGSVSAPEEHKGSVTQPSDNTPAFVPARKVRATGSEKVKISNPSGKSSSSDKSAPSKPAQERQQADDSKNKDSGGKDTGRDNKDTGRDNKDRGR
jgi:hypothetical protein